MKAVHYVNQYATGSIKIQQFYNLLIQFFFVRTSEQAAVNTALTV